MDTFGPKSTLEVFEEAKRRALAKDLAGFADLFAADGVHELPFAPPGIPRRLQGRAKLREYFTSISETPLRHDEFRNMAVYRTTDPEVIVVEYDAHGYVTGSAREYELRYLHVVRVCDGEIALWRDYWNPLASAELLGRVPQLLAHYTGADRG
ncbi:MULTISPECIES: nuclear transport factor 2 family protein [unclassified Nocardia]|uniref:nuclear transport factor 2 family protein n=1 Tax=unclassified Nocardia TaxID=2637762 RepID=UPI001CE48497|nr:MULTISPECIES: nuclear transport factor 2 family protein [unclassified Nocardia]